MAKRSIETVDCRYESNPKRLPDSEGRAAAHDILQLVCSVDHDDVDNTEIWQSLSPLGYNQVEASTLGRIRRANTHQIVNNKPTRTGFIRMAFKTADNRRETKMVHTIVARTFIPQPPGCPFVVHKSADKTDNRVDNLQWASAECLASRIPRHRTNHSNRRGVIRIDKDGSEIVYESRRAAAAALTGPKCSPSDIGRACRSKGNAAGFKWRHCDDPDLDGEIWRRIDEPQIMVSNMGRVQSHGRHKRHGHPTGDGYFTIHLYKKIYRVHALVCLAFYGKCPNNMTVDHIDGNRANNRLSNLRYATGTEQSLNRLLPEEPRSTSRPVYQFSLDYVFIRRFQNAEYACKAVAGVPRKGIPIACKYPERTAGGYRWFYKEGIDKSDVLCAAVGADLV